MIFRHPLREAKIHKWDNDRTFELFYESGAIHNVVTKMEKVITAGPEWASGRQYIPQVSEQTEEFFQRNNIVVISREEMAKDPADRLRDWHHETSNAALKTLFTQNGWKVADLAVGRGASCFEYALTLGKVNEAFENNAEPAALPDLLPTWGYEQVEGSQPDDLVLFLDKNVPVHMGFQTKNGVLSKPGNERPFAYYHTVEEAYVYYGDQVRYFRKKTS